MEGLQTLLRYRPNVREGWILLGACFRKVGDVKSALRAETTVVEVAPEDPIARRRLAEVFLSCESLGRARFELQEVVRLRPEEPEAYFSLASLATREKKYEEAEGLYRKILRYNFPERFGGTDARAQRELTAVYEKMIAAGDKKAPEKLSKLKAGKLVLKDVKIVLSWETSGTDVDLWITAPGEEKCSYQQKYTFRGGRLDRDDTDGHGPETYTMPDMRPGEWLVQVNYYSGTVVTRGKVEIVLYEGTDREIAWTFPFELEKAKETITLFKGPFEFRTRRGIAPMERARKR
jgi:hypothetical protein